MFFCIFHNKIFNSGALLLFVVLCCVQEIDLKAGGGYAVTVGEMCRMMLTSLDWFGTLFPRLPVLVQKDVTKKLEAFPAPDR